MKRLGFLLLPSVVVLGVIGIVFWAAPTLAGLPNSMANSDYSGQPSFIPPVVTPNILFIIDSTSTMQHREYEGIAFTASTTFSGLFDPMKCYTYDSTDTRFEPSATAKGAATPAVAGTCASTLWDGNFVNWLAYRRADAVKKAATGGSCVGATPPRDANANCNPSGSPAMPTITHMTNSREYYTEAVSSATYTGRMPIPTGSPTWYFKILATGASLCGGTSTSCGSSDPKWVLRVALESQPRGVLHDFAGKARFGLMQFSGSPSSDIEVIVPIGGRQALDYTGTVMETFNTNTAAMVDAVDEIF